MSISPTYTRDAILAQVAKINCCSANMAFTITDDAQKGVETCDCEIEELAYLNDSRETLNNYYPTGSLVNYSVPNVALVSIPTNYVTISNTVLKIDGVTVYTQSAGTVANIGTVLGNIVTAGVATYTLTHPLTLILMLVAPLTVYAGIKVSITFNYVLGGAQVYTQSFTFGGGAYLMTSAAQCLTTLQVDSIIENTTQICGCAGCTQNEDTAPQANAVVINNVVSSIAVVNISSADFSGNNYQNNLLIGKVPGTDFDVFTFPSVGLGALLHVNDGYSFNAGTGTLTMPPGDYKIIIYNA